MTTAWWLEQAWMAGLEMVWHGDLGAEMDLGPEIRITDELIANPPVSPITGLDLVRVVEASIGSRSKVLIHDDFGHSWTYVLTDHDPITNTFGLRWPD